VKGYSAVSWVKKRSIIIVFHDYDTIQKDWIRRGESAMNKTLIVLGAGIWGVMLLLRFVLPTNIDSNTSFLLNVIEIVAFIITIVGILRRD
jgi:hypothetical protein